MQPKCRQAVDEAAKALGRAIPTAKQYQEIEDQISASMRNLARRDPAGWQSLTRDQQMTLAAKSLMEDIAAQAQRKLDNAERQVLRIAETEQRIEALKEAYGGTRADALKRDYELTDMATTADRKIAQGSLLSLIEASADRTGAGLGRNILMRVFDAENPIMTRDIVAEIFKNADGHTANAPAKIAARAWLDTIEGLRTRFNAAGGDVGKLEYGYVPQPHNLTKIRKAGRETWALVTMQYLDRSRYLLEDGSRMSDSQVLDMLHNAYETISTSGLNKSEPGAFKGTGARANRGGDSRQIHFADGAAWSEYMKAFGSGSVYDSMMAHIGGITRDIGLIERYGPDANANARLQHDLVTREDAPAVTAGEKAGSVFRIEPETYWNMISGVTGAPKNEPLANTMQMVRNFQVASKLGAAVVSSVTDLGTLAMTTGYNRLPYWQLIKDIGANFTKDGREFMASHGMIAESLASTVNRWSGDNIGATWSGKMANSVMKLSLLNAWTDGLRQGFTMSMNAGLARMAEKQWGALNEFDRSRLTRAGITESDWTVLNGIAPENYKGRKLLTPQTIKASGHEQANSIAAKVFGLIHDESEFAVVNPDLATRAISTFGGQQAGTAAGEIARTVMQFKSFPIAMMTRHWSRLFEGDHGADGAPLMANRVAYGMALAATTAGLGAIATQEKQLLAGKDPIDMTKGRFWAKAIAQGGGLSIFGDLFLIDPANSATDSATTAIKNLAGPTVGTVTDLALKSITENIWQEMEGKDSHWQAELFAWGKGQIPGANLWWLKPMIEHGMTNAWNEGMSPGYLSRVQQRSQKDWGNRFWWKPDEGMPGRAPDLEAALGK